MASVMLSALAGLGAAAHAVGVAERLRSRGHRVSVVTSEAAASAYRDAGFEVHLVPEPPMPGLLGSLPPVVRRGRQALARVQQHIIEPLPRQWDVVRRVIADAAIDVVVTDALFLGASMLAARPRASRPAVVMLGFFAPWIPDPAVPPYGMGFSPSDDQGTDRIRATAFGLLAAPAWVRLSRSFNAEVERTFGVSRRGDLRSSPAVADVWAQLTVPRFEYPRTALPANFRFVGPLHPPTAEALPDWWDPAREPPVVAVRAGSSAALHELVLPTVRAFGGADVTVIVAGTSRADTEAAHPGRLAPNIHFEERLPWSRLHPARTVVVSDGDYLHTQHALRRGIPLVLGGTLETDVETAARVAWSGAGVDLRTQRPTAEVIRAAVERVRGTDAYRVAASRIAAQIATTDAEGTICDLVEEPSAVGGPSPAAD